MKQSIKALATAAAFAGIILTGMFLLTPLGSADDDREDGNGDSAAQKGLAIAPVPLNLHGKNRALVGRGSYIVNAQSGCNDCHYRPNGTDPAVISPFLSGGNPFLGQTEMIDQTRYLAGGPLTGPSPNFGPFVPRNLTPDKTGLPEGGASYSEFLGIMRTGIDPDHAHPQFGPFLQVMPWPVFRNMSDLDLRAIYEYLSAIPCIEGDPGLPNPRPIGTRCH